MRHRIGLICAALIITALGGCYPGYVGLGTPSVTGPTNPPDYQNVQENINACHAHLDEVARNAYNERRDQYKLTNLIASITFVGGSASTFFGDKTVKTIGGVASLLTGLAGILKGKAEADVEGVQARDGKVRETWGGVLDNISKWRNAWNDAGGHTDNAAYLKADAGLLDALTKCTGLRFN